MTSIRLADFLRTTRGVSSSSAADMIRSGLTVMIILISFALMLGIFILLDLVFSPEPSQPNSLRNSLGVVSAMGMAAISFTGTSVMLVNYRARGTLRLLGSTPLSRIAFLCGQMPIRMLIAVSELIVIGVAMAALGAREPIQFMNLALSGLSGFFMFMALGVLLGARGNNSDIAMQISLAVPLIVIFTSGVAVPLDSLPEWAHVMIDVLPTTWFMDAINSWAGAERSMTLPVAWTCMLGVAILATIAAASLFDWGHGD